MSVDLKALETAWEAYCPHLSGRPDKDRLATAIEAYTAALPPAPHGGAEAVAWESTTDCYIKFITDSKYRRLNPQARSWYKPYRCSNCASPPQEQEAAPKGEAVAWQWRRRIKVRGEWSKWSSWSFGEAPYPSAALIQFEERVLGVLAPPSPKAELEQEAVAVERHVIRVRYKTGADHGWWHFPSLEAWMAAKPLLPKDVWITDIEDWPIMDGPSAVKSLEHEDDDIGQYAPEVSRHQHDSLLQRDRPLCGPVAAQPNCRRPHCARRC